MTLNMILSIMQMPFVGFIIIILLACLLSAVRGTFAYKRVARVDSAALPADGEGPADRPSPPLFIPRRAVFVPSCWR